MTYDQDQLIFQARKLPESYIFNFTQRFREVSFKAGDGGQVSGVEFSAATNCQNERGGLLFVHGNATSVEGLAGRVSDFTDRCYRSLFVDFRPFGKSKGKLSENSLILDSQAGFDLLEEEAGVGRVIVFGQSLGTGLAVWLAATRNVKNLLLEAPYLSLLELVEERYSLFPVKWMLRYPLRSDLLISKVSAPISIFHGSLDTTIPIEHGRALAKLAPGQVTFVELPGGTHFNVPGFPQYQAELDRVLGPKNLN